MELTDAQRNLTSIVRVYPALDDVSQQALETLTEALGTSEALVRYLTRYDRVSSLQFWHEILRLACHKTTAAPLLCLSDGSSAAAVLEYPNDRCHFGLVPPLRLLAIAPVTKWRTIASACSELDKQKQAFYKSHGPFLHLVGVGTKQECRGRGMASLLVHTICRTADKRRCYVYTEVTSSSARSWYKTHFSFTEVLQYSVKQKSSRAPKLYVLVRAPKFLHSEHS